MLIFYANISLILDTAGRNSITQRPLLGIQPDILHCSEATFILVPIAKRGVSKRGILKSLVSHVLNLKTWSNSFVVAVCNFVKNKFNPSF